MTIYTRNTEGVLTPLKLPVIKGKDGKDGKNGVTPNITLGEVNTMESGEEVNVIIKGDKENPILDFNLPKGEEGLNIALSSDKIDRKLKRIDSRVKEIETKNEEQEKRIKEVEDKEKKQNFYINGLFNENEDGRVSIEEKGNDIKLESSRKGFVEVDKIVGNTMVNLAVSDNFEKQLVTMNGCKFHIIKDKINYAYLTIPLDKMYLFKSNGKYKVIVNITKNTLVEEGGTQWAFRLPTYNYAGDAIETSTDGYYSLIYNIGEVGMKECVITMKDFTNPSNPISKFVMRFESSFYATSGELEGYLIICEYKENEIYPNEPFKGIQSTFEDKLVTQEMVDSGLEKAENLGKYKMNLKVRGKNRFSPEVIDALCDLKNWEGTGPYRDNKVAYDIFWENINRSSSITISIPTIKVPPKFYPILGIIPSRDGHFLASGIYNNSTNETMSFPNRIWKASGICDNGKFNTAIGDYDNWNKQGIEKLRNILEQNIMIEIGHTNASYNNPPVYEPYFEHSKTVYLNSPLYKGDEIVWKEDGLYHYHKMGSRILNGSVDEKWVISTPLTNIGCTKYVTALNVLDNAKSTAVCINNYGLANTNPYSDPKSGLFIFSNCVRVRLKEGVDEDLNNFKDTLSKNPLTLIYELAEPYYEKISDDKLLLEIPENATLHIDSTIPCQNTKVNYTSRIPSLLTMEDDISNINKCSIDMIANNFDMDYRLLEVEWALEDIGINLVDTRRINNTGLSRFHQAKLLITSGEYDKEKLTCQLSEYLERRYLDQEEFNELIDLMD